MTTNTTPETMQSVSTQIARDPSWSLYRDNSHQGWALRGLSRADGGGCDGQEDDVSNISKRPAEVTICRLHGSGTGPSATTIRVEILDSETRAMVRADLTPDAFGQAVTGLGNSQADAIWYGMGKLEGATGAGATGRPAALATLDRLECGVRARLEPDDLDAEADSTPTLLDLIAELRAALAP